MFTQDHEGHDRLPVVSSFSTNDWPGFSDGGVGPERRLNLCGRGSVPGRSSHRRRDQAARCEATHD